MWLVSNSSYFKAEHMLIITDQGQNLSDDQANLLLGIKLKNPTFILLFSIFIGELGVDRFLLGDTGLGVGKLLTFGGCLVWWFIDLFLVMDRAREVNYTTVMQAIGSIR
jgi:TM2 domain-containing membrane protein YozV